MEKNEKTKILLIGWELCSSNMMLRHELKELAEKYEIVFTQYLSSAIEKMAKATLIEKKPIMGFIFRRDTLVVSQKKCQVVFDVAKAFADKEVIFINMVLNDQDHDAKQYAVSSYCCQTQDWKKVEAIFDNGIKKNN
jgi:hypothetical protein